MLPKAFDIQGLRIAATENLYTKSYNKIKGSFVTSMIRYNDVYIYVMSMCPGWEERVVTSVWHPEVYNKNLGKNGKFVVGIYKNENRWELHQASYTGIVNQDISMFEGQDSLKQYITTYWKKGYDVTGLVTDKGKYYVVMSKGLNLKQGWAMSPVFPEKVAMQAYKEGMILTEVSQVEDSYLWIFSSNTGFEDQALEYNPDNDKIHEIRKGINSDNGFDGYSLASVKEVSGKLLFIFVR